jgi:subtilisin family serine protease
MGDAPGQLISRREFLLVPGFAAEVDATTLKWLKSHPLVEHIELDIPGSGHMAEGGALANIPDIFSAGLTGAGVKVAIVDSGIDTDHPDFAGRLVGQQCFCSGDDGATGCCPNGLETESGDGAAEDGNGHGTNVAGILAGGGTVALRGAAPGAEIVAVRVLANNNSFCCLSDVVAGFDWVRVHHPDARVLNASLGTNALYAGSCDSEYSAMSAAVNNLVANGTMVFVSSGNQGSSTEMASPACISNSISVGAVWDAPRSPTTTLGCTDSDIIASKPTCFTNSNETLDLYAPGAVITSSGRGGGASSYSGTSMASPMTAGCAASLRGWQPQASIEQIEAALKASSSSVTDSKNNLVFPLLDCLDAKNRIGDINIPFADGFEN